MKESVEETTLRYVIQDMFGVDMGLIPITFPPQYTLNIKLSSRRDIDVHLQDHQLKKLNTCLEEIFPDYKLCSISVSKDEQ
jgi:hypothetical protein